MLHDTAKRLYVGSKMLAEQLPEQLPEQSDRGGADVEGGAPRRFWMPENGCRPKSLWPM